MHRQPTTAFKSPSLEWISCSLSDTISHLLLVHIEMEIKASSFGIVRAQRCIPTCITYLWLRLKKTVSIIQLTCYTKQFRLHARSHRTADCNLEDNVGWRRLENDGHAVNEKMSFECFIVAAVAKWIGSFIIVIIIRSWFWSVLSSLIWNEFE